MFDDGRCLEESAGGAAGTVVARRGEAGEAVDLDGLSDGELLSLAGRVVRRVAHRPLTAAVDDAALTASLGVLHRLATMVEAEKLRRLAEVDTRNAYVGRARSAADLLADSCQLSRGEALRQSELAGGLARLPRTAEALADGAIGVAQAREATRTLAELHDAVDAGGLDVEGLEQATALVDGLVAEEGRRCDPRRLRRDLDDLAARTGGGHLAAREARAFARRYLWIGRAGGRDDGLFKIEGLLDVVTGAKLQAALAPLARRSGPDDARDVRQRRHDALGRLCDQARDTATLPDSAVQRPHVLLVTSPDALHDLPGAPASLLDGVGPVSTATARQLCCDADVTPIVTDRNGAVLDVGRTRRFPNSRQRRAVIARDRGCVGCGAPALACQVHHNTWWEHGGSTDLDNLANPQCARTLLRHTSSSFDEGTLSV